MEDNLKFYEIDSQKDLVAEDIISEKEYREFANSNPMVKIFFSATAVLTLSTASSTLQASEKRKAEKDKIDFKICQTDFIQDYLRDEEDLFNVDDTIVLLSFSDLEYLRNKYLTHILSFKSLTNSWDGYGAVPAEIKVTANTISFLNKLDDSTLNKVKDLSPNPHGTISIYFNNNSNENIEVEIGNTLFSYYVDFNNIDTHYFDSITFNNKNVKKLIERIKYL